MVSKVQFSFFPFLLSNASLLLNVAHLPVKLYGVRASPISFFITFFTAENALQNGSFQECHCHFNFASTFKNLSNERSVLFHNITLP